MKPESHRPLLPLLPLLSLLALAAVRVPAAGAADVFARLAAAVPRGSASAFADVDGDGVPDAVCGHATAAGGAVAVFPGNVDAVYPNTPGAQARKRARTFTSEAFLEPRVYETPVAADLVAVGDFDADGHADVVAAKRGTRQSTGSRGTDTAGSRRRSASRSWAG